MFKLICENCGNEELLQEEYKCFEDAKFNFTTLDRDIFLECKECHKEIIL
jgi:hypothetical protein